MAMLKAVIVLVGVTCLGHLSLLAAIAEKAPSAEDWVQKLKSSKNEALMIPKTIAIIDAFASDDIQSGVPQFKKIEAKLCAQQSFFVCSPSDDSQFTVSINSPAQVGGVAGVVKITGADLIVFKENDNINIATPDLKVSRKLPIKAADYPQTTLPKLLNGAMKALGYDGVVLASENGYVLVGSLQTKLQKESLQGLSLSDSDKVIALESVDRKGASLLTLVNSWKGYGVFQEIVLKEGSTNIPLGSKIILENSKKEPAE